MSPRITESRRNRHQPRVLKHAEAAIKVGRDDPQALSIAAFARAHVTRDFAGSIALLEEALAINGNSALTLRLSSVMHAYAGRYDRTRELAMMALRLSPIDPMNYHPYLALTVASYCSGEFDRAIEYSTSAVRANPEFNLSHAFLVASHIELGQPEAAADAARRLMEADPSFAIGKVERLGYLRQSLFDALRAAGLPD